MKICWVIGFGLGFAYGPKLGISPFISGVLGAALGFGVGYVIARLMGIDPFKDSKPGKPDKAP